MLFIPPAESDYLRSPPLREAVRWRWEGVRWSRLPDESVSERALIGCSMGTVVGRGSSFLNGVTGETGVG
jgi:hypothetical protein